MGGGAGTSTPAVMCLRCGYDLRTVDAAGVCPECGLAAAVSTKPRERLQDCTPSWVRRVAVGKAAQVLTLQQQHALGVGGESVVGGFEERLVAGGVQRGEFACEHLVGQQLSVDAVWVVSHGQVHTLLALPTSTL